MIIEELDKTKIKTFGTLCTGEIFQSNSIYYLVIPFFEDAMTKQKYNAYDLENDEYFYFCGNEEVTLVKAKLVIE